MLPGPLAPLDVHKTRALSTIYAPRKLKSRKHKTARSRMLEDVPIKPSLSPFHPLPAIGQHEPKVLVFDIKPEKRTIKLHDVKPLTPLNVHYYRKKEVEKPQQLIRENTYDVLEPTYLSASKGKARETKPSKDVAMSPKTRFKNAALQVAKLTSNKERGKLLCLREKETFTICQDEDKFRLHRLPQSPVEKLDKLTEIFQGLEMKGRHRDKLKKENSWF
ncbi:uncharacterized protein LOC121731975 [Aricia agestis]|uniref:uncharacterized protein LOC121731975 n=1 Tax=Aricia agestis TaxID=91739 RepID=UPI001C20BCCF|nr:uncharacterized protein LOC121731975 [Aricia agestis]